jgi:hypothetical protein
MFGLKVALLFSFMKKSVSQNKLRMRKSACCIKVPAAKMCLLLKSAY